MGVERNPASWPPLCHFSDPEHLRGGVRLLPRCSCPYAGTTRIRFEGLPRRVLVSGLSAPCQGTPWRQRLSAECHIAVKYEQGAREEGSRALFSAVPEVCRVG